MFPTALFRIHIFCNVTLSVGHSFHDITKACNAFNFKAEGNGKTQFLDAQISGCTVSSEKDFYAHFWF